MRKLLTAVVLAMVAVLSLGACAPQEPLTVGAETVIVDVRTPAEYAAGHLDGAVNIDVSAPDFRDAITKLPVDGEYIVYCQSGKRSAKAASIMTDSGLKNLTDAGGIGDASTATGIEIVK